MLKLSALCFEYPSPQGPVQVLNGIDLDVKEGERVALMGANGSGKTTLVRCLNGLLRPARGEVRVNGLSTGDEKNLNLIRRSVGMVFQNPENQIVATTVEREIAFGLENLSVPRPEMHRIVDEMLERFSLKSYRTYPPHLLSGGEMQRLAIASVMAMRPALIILDEPTSLLDPAARKALASIISDLHKPDAGRRRMTILIATQDPLEALACDRVLVIHNGLLVLDGPPSSVFSQTGKLEQIGVNVPIEFEICDLIQKASRGRISLNPAELLPIF